MISHASLLSRVSAQQSDVVKYQFGFIRSPARIFLFLFVCFSFICVCMFRCRFACVAAPDRTAVAFGKNVSLHLQGAVLRLVDRCSLTILQASRTVLVNMWIKLE